jgi:hypothetical protein
VCRFERLLLIAQKLITYRVMDETIRNLRYLPIRNLELYESEIKSLSDIATFPLSRLCLDCEHISDSDLSHLSLMPLKHIKLSNIQISGSGFVHFKAMPLQHLDLSCSYSITDAGLAHLQHLQLQYLDLSFCQLITDVGVSYVSSMPLTHLYLRNCRFVTDASLARLASQKLEELALAGCDITNDGLLHLASMPLVLLDIYLCPRVTEVGVTYIKQAHPSFKGDPNPNYPWLYRFLCSSKYRKK